MFIRIKQKKFSFKYFLNSSFISEVFPKLSVIQTTISGSFHKWVKEVLLDTTRKTISSYLFENIFVPRFFYMHHTRCKLQKSMG